MTDQKLVNELEKALTDEAYDGGMGALDADQFRELVRTLAVTAAEVVEKAHTPSDDEREALAAPHMPRLSGWGCAMSTAVPGRCGAIGHAPPIVGGFRVTCGLEAGHDRPLPIEDWAHCAICGGTRCKGIANGSDHAFVPTEVDVRYMPHRLWVEWPSGPATDVVAEEPEWEYGIRLNQTGTADKVILWPESEASNPFSGTRVRRVPAIPAGPWVPVKQEGPE